MSIKSLQENQEKDNTNKIPDAKKYPLKPSDEKFEAMTDDDVIDFAEKLGIKFAECFPEKERVVRVIKQFYQDLKFKPPVHFNRITKEDRALLKQKIKEFQATQDALIE